MVKVLKAIHFRKMFERIKEDLFYLLMHVQPLDSRIRLHSVHTLNSKYPEQYYWSCATNDKRSNWANCPAPWQHILNLPWPRDDRYQDICAFIVCVSMIMAVFCGLSKVKPRECTTFQKRHFCISIMTFPHFCSHYVCPPLLTGLLRRKSFRET